jgi:hypothetical protein
MASAWLIGVMWRIIVNTSGMGHRDRFERIASSGCVFSEKPVATGCSKNSQVNGILFRLIEEEMELSFRSQNCLNNAGIKLIGQLVQKTEAELINLKNFGSTSLREIGNTLTEMGLTLEMTLDFPPWNGDSNDNELIQILSLQRVGGGFLIGHKAVRTLGIDLKEVNQELRNANPVNNGEKLSILHTRYLLDLLESKFEKDMPYLTGLINPHRKWLQKRLR